MLANAFFFMAQALPSTWSDHLRELSFTHYQLEPTAGKRRDEALVAIAEHACPDYLVVHQAWAVHSVHIVPALEAHGWRLTPLNPRAFFAYLIYNLTPPRALAATNR